MAEIGQQLFTAEEGWQRYDSPSPYITGGTSYNLSGSYGGSINLSAPESSPVSFSFFGTKLRLICYFTASHGTSHAIDVDGVSFTFSTYRNTELNQALAFELLDLSEGLHEVNINADFQLGLDAIDIDSNGYIIDPNSIHDTSDLTSSIIIPYASIINGTLVILPQNKMTARVKIIGVSRSSLSSNVIVTMNDNLKSNMIVYSDYVVESVSYPPRFGNQRKASLLVPFRVNLNSSIVVIPKNKMTATVEIIEPPIYELELSPIKDAFIRSGIPTLNYGTEQMIVVGRNNEQKESYRSLLGFDLSSMPNNAIVQDVHLQVYNIVDRNSSHQVGVYSAASDWTETGVTWDTQPAIEDILDIQDIGTIKGYRSFDVTEKVNEWLSGAVNNGLILKAIDENVSGVDQFYSRESAFNKPKLIIRYKQDIIYSFGRLPLESSVFVYAVGSKDILGSVNVRQFDDERDMPSQIHVKNYNWMLEGELTVSRPNVVSTIQIRRDDRSILDGSVIVGQKGTTFLENELVVSRPFLVSSVGVKFATILQAEIIVRANEFDTLNSKIIVSKPEIQGRLIVVQNDMDDLESLITVKRINESRIQGFILVTRPSLPSHLIVQQTDQEFITGIAIVVQSKDSDIPSTASISRRDVLSNLSVVYSSIIQGSITVRQSDKSSIDGNLNVLYRKNINGSLRVVHATRIPGSLDVLSGYLAGSVVIPYRANRDWIGRVTVRVRTISEIPSTVMVGGDNIPGSYVFIL